MSSEQSLSIADEPSPKSTAPFSTETERPARNDAEKTSPPLSSRAIKLGTFTDRMKSYFTTHEGRIVLVSLSLTLVCVLLQHIMGTCQHSVSDGGPVVKWHVFTPPCMLVTLKLRRKENPFLVGAGPHTAVFFFVLSWTTLVYCLERIWVYLTSGVRLSKKRDLIVHGIIVLLYLLALGFNIWGEKRTEKTSPFTGCLSLQATSFAKVRVK